MAYFGGRGDTVTYKEMYFYLYAKIADALECLKDGKIITGIYTLEQAHIKTEEMAMETDVITDQS